MLDWVLNMPLNCQSSIFSGYDSQSTNVLNQKMNVFNIEIIMALENAGGGRSLIIPRKLDGNHPN